MKGIIQHSSDYFKFFIIILSLFFFSSCDGITPAEPVIHSFTADSTTIDEGDSVALSWSVSDASTVTISQGIGSVALSGSTSVSPADTTTYTLTATNGAGSSTSTVTITVHAVIVEQTLTIQPGPEEGKDSYVSSLIPGMNYGANDYLSFGQDTFTVSTLGVHRANYINYVLRAYLQFDLSELSSAAVIERADLMLFQPIATPIITTVGSPGLVIGAFQVTEGWEESSITWNDQPFFSSSPESTITILPMETGWRIWDIASLLQGWVEGSIPNHGVVLKHPGTNTVISINCYSSDYTGNSALRPKLEITYYVP